MAERNIKILVRDKKALVEGGPVIVCGNSDYTITFDFDDDWSPAGVRTARFVYVRGGQVRHQDVVFEGTTASVPVLSGITSVKVGVFEGDLSTTTPASIRCKESILCGTGKPEEPTPDVYDQIMALFDSLADQGAFGATEEQARQIEANRAGVEALTNGTTPAGNATKLGGKDASEYALGKAVTILTAFPNGITSNSTMQDLLNALGTSTILHVRADKPLVPENYSTLTVFKHGANYVLAFAKSQLSNILYYGSIGGDSSWGGWNRTALNTDLANYLPLSGGTVGGAGYRIALKLKGTDDVLLGCFNSNDELLGYYGVSAEGKPIFYSNSNKTSEFLHTGNVGSYAVSKDAGTATNFTLGYHSRLGVPGFEAKNNLGEVVACFGIDKTTNRIKIWNAGMTTAKFCLDTENSAATKVQASAPSDTTAVWVW